MPWARLVSAGLVASVIMGMITMMWEAVAGEGFWSPVLYIGATILRSYQTVAHDPAFAFAPVMLGLTGHMMNSVIFAVVFGLVAYRFATNRFALAMVGAVYGLIVFAMMWYLVLPAVDPVMLRVNGAGLAVSHVMWGAALGVIAARNA